MGSNDNNLQQAEEQAAQLIAHYNIIKSADINLETIAHDLGVISIKEGKLSGAAANLIQLGPFATIRLRKENYEPRKRFSIAHEIGHLVLKHKFQSVIKICSADDMAMWGITKSTQETEANCFAGELLLPASLLKDRCITKDVSFSHIAEIAKDFNSTLTSAAVRFIKFSPHKCAIVSVNKGVVSWFRASETWNKFIRCKSKVDPRTVAARCFLKKMSAKETFLDQEEVEANSWVKGCRDETIIEHTIHRPNQGYTLSLLWFM